MSRRNSSKPKVASGLKKTSTHRSCSRFSMLANTTHDLSIRLDIRTRLAAAADPPGRFRIGRTAEILGVEINDRATMPAAAEAAERRREAGHRQAALDEAPGEVAHRRNEQQQA